MRQASRQLVRELNLLEGIACGGPLSLSEAHFLFVLNNLGEGTIVEIAERLVLDKSTVSRVCSALEKKHLVTCQTRSGDRRRKPLQVTQDGIKELETISLVADQQVNEALQFVAEPERVIVVRGLARYARALRYARLSRGFTLRAIEPKDNPVVAGVIRKVMTEFGAVGPGYSIEDPEVDDMYQAYAGDRAAFFVVAKKERLLGCGGIAPLVGGDDDTCELKKMYFLSELRGTGMGTRVLNASLDAARSIGYQRCYLETLDSMHHARKLYAKHGFEPLEGPMGCTGHSACDSWMAKDLQSTALGS